MQAINMITACSLCNIYLWTFGDYDTCHQYDIMQLYDTIADIISMADRDAHTASITISPISGPIFTMGTDVLMQDLIKSQSRDIRV